MQAIASTLGNFMGFIGSIFSAVWSAVLSVVDAIWAAIIYLVGHVAILLVDVLFWIVMAALSILPDPPAAPLAGATDAFSHLSAVNQYVPVVEVGVLFTVWLAIFGWRAAMKLWKMLPLT